MWATEYQLIDLKVMLLDARSESHEVGNYKGNSNYKEITQCSLAFNAFPDDITSWWKLLTNYTEFVQNTLYSNSHNLF